MVTDAVWSDYDGDGWEDLIISREWNSNVILKNQEGKNMVSQEIPEIEAMHGIWYSVTAGDFDQDGDDDYIFGNLGDNHRFTASDVYPLRIYAFDLDRNGTLDPISTGYWRNKYDVMEEYPVNYFDELVGQTPYFAKIFKNYTSFSYATIGEMLDEEMMSRIDYIFHANTLSSYVVWNNENEFKWEKLPAEAQVAPISKTIVQDFNQDGIPDVLLTGNDHTYDISTGYYDASKGLILMSSNNTPLSEVFTPSQSGLVIHGMVESLLYVEGDSPLIMAGINRDSIVTFSLRK
jgi:hypothetical protein